MTAPYSGMVFPVLRPTVLPKSSRRNPLTAGIVRRGHGFLKLPDHPQSVSLLTDRDGGCNCFDDLLVYTAVHQLFPDPDGVLNRAAVGPAVTDEAVPADSEQGGSAVFLPVVLGVNLLHHRLELAE